MFPHYSHAFLSVDYWVWRWGGRSGSGHGPNILNSSVVLVEEEEEEEGAGGETRTVETIYGHCAGRKWWIIFTVS